MVYFYLFIICSTRGVLLRGKRVGLGITFIIDNEPVNVYFLIKMVKLSADILKRKGGRLC
jgi:hypothetical protein